MTLFLFFLSPHFCSSPLSQLVHLGFIPGKGLNSSGTLSSHLCFLEHDEHSQHDSSKLGEKSDTNFCSNLAPEQQGPGLFVLGQEVGEGEE